jgi:hypothetical protein
MNIKDKFPTEESLKQAIDTNLDLYVQQIKAAIGHLEVEYIQKSHARNIGIGLAVSGFVVAATPLYAVGVFASMPAVIVSLLIAVFLIIKGWLMTRGTLKIIYQFNAEMNKQIYDVMCTVFGLEGYCSVYADEHIDTGVDKKHRVESLLTESELITESRNRLVVDDMYTIDKGQLQLHITELDIKNVTGSGKNRQVKHIFKGLFVSLELQKILEGKTFVSTEGDRSGFGHQSFVKNMIGKGIQPTELEWNDFENLLHVVTSDPTEARYILTPDLMTDLHDWWKTKKQNIRISFKENHMFMLFPDSNIRFASTVGKISPKEVKVYLESIAIPTLHVLHLVEDIQARFSR